MNKKGLLVIVSGPSGAGKGTVVDILKNDSRFALSISVTTREPRINEKDGVNYFFRSEEEFKKMADNKEFLEYAIFCGNYYGTPISYVNQKLEEGKNVILEIEVQGALQVKEIFKEAILIFLTPPSINELKHRLENRATEPKDRIEMRLNRAKEEFDMMDKYDYIVINNEIEKASNDIKNIVYAEKMRADRNLYLKNILKGDEIKC